jgi:hypothetical protein
MDMLPHGGLPMVGPNKSRLSDMYKQRMAQLLLQQGASGAPVQSVGEGISRALMGALGGYQAGQLDREDDQRNANIAAELSRALSLQTTPDPTVAGPRAGTGVTSQPTGEGVIKALIASQYPELQTKGLEMYQHQLESAEKPQIIPAGGTLMVGNKPVYTNPKTERPGEFSQMLEAAGIAPGSPEAQKYARDALARKGQGQQITVNTGDTIPAGQKQFAEKVGAGDAEAFQNISTAGRNANLMLGNLSQLDDLLAKTPQGSAIEMVRPLANFAQSIGIDVGEAAGLAPAQAITAIVQRLAPSLRTPGSGSQSDAELRGFLASLPSLANTPEGNRMIVSGLRMFADRSVKEAEIANMALNGEIDRADARKKILALGPVLPKGFSAPGQPPGPQASNEAQPPNGDLDAAIAEYQRRRAERIAR